MIARLGRQLVADYVGRSANNDDAGRRLLSDTLLERDTLLVIDNLESIVAAPHESTGMAGSGVPASGVAGSRVAGVERSEPPVDGSAESRPDQAPRRSGTTSDTDTSATLSATTDDVLTPLFALLAELNALGKTRILFTTRTPLPAPFDSNHVRIGRLSESAAVELVGNVLGESSRTPRANDAGESESEIRALVESVNCHARSLVLLAREVAERGVTATTSALRELMQSLHERFGDDRERSLFASVELSLRRMPPDLRQQLPPLSVYHSGFHFASLAMSLWLFHGKPQATASAPSPPFDPQPQAQESAAPSPNSPVESSDKKTVASSLPL